MKLEEAKKYSTLFLSTANYAMLNTVLWNLNE
jgi:hypothetical protein